MVFVKKTLDKEGRSIDQTLGAAMGFRPVKGQVGLEIECEAAKAGSLPRSELGKYWTYHADGSLRGADNAEYVFAVPLTFDKVDEAVDELWALFKKTKTKLAESMRTSVHVHLNVTDFYHNRLASLLALWFTVEEILSYYSGEHRAGNLFCIRAKDGPAIITAAKKWLESNGEEPFNTENMHYSALNLGAMYKFGSVEVRTMRGLTEGDTVKKWVKILRCIYDASANYTDPRTVIEQFSLLGPVEFFNSLFGEYANEIAEVARANVDVTGSLYEGMRFAQDVAYCKDWSQFNPVEPVYDPFGRKAGKTAIPRTLAETMVAQGRAMFEGNEPQPPAEANRPFRVTRIANTAAANTIGRAGRVPGWMRNHLDATTEN